MKKYGMVSSAKFPPCTWRITKLESSPKFQYPELLCRLHCLDRNALFSKWLNSKPTSPLPKVRQKSYRRKPQPHNWSFFAWTALTLSHLVSSHCQLWSEVPIMKNRHSWNSEGAKGLEITSSNLDKDRASLKFLTTLRINHMISQPCLSNELLIKAWTLVLG